LSGGKKDRKIIVNFTLNIKNGKKVTAAQPQNQAAELKATAVLEANEAASSQRLKQQQDALEMEVFEDAPVADLDTPVAGEEIENGAEVPQNEGPDETETSTTRR
jgi:hypothetical protein